MNNRHTVIHGDCRDMKLLQDKSVDLIVTSPPYWNLKDYGDARQIGYGDSYDGYISNLNAVWRECFRVLKDGCRLCVNIGDQFTSAVSFGKHKVMPIHCEIIRFCETLGFDFMGQIIWQKVPNMKTSGGACIMGSYPYPKNGMVKYDFEYIQIFKKQGNAVKPGAVQKELSRMTKDEWNTYFTGHWRFPGVKQKGHSAMFPKELPRRLIKMFSFYGDTVLDPFAGSGTTLKAAKALGRNSVGYEIVSEYIPVIADKLGSTKEINIILENKERINNE